MVDLSHGSARGSPGDAGIGGVLRDSNGKVWCLFSSYVGFTDSNSAEVLAIHRACNLIVSNRLLDGRNIVIISDSRSAVSWMNGSDFGNIKLVQLVYDVRQALQFREGLSVKFMTRNFNSFADGLAKDGSGRNGERLVWEVS